MVSVRVKGLPRKKRRILKILRVIPVIMKGSPVGLALFVDYFGIHGIIMAQRVFVWSKIQNIPY